MIDRPGNEITDAQVLIVEDERITRRAMAQLLAASGYPNQAVGSAEEALRWVSRGGLPRVVLADLDLPGMSGLELLGRLAQRDASLVPVLITAAGGETLRSTLRSRGFAYLQKPVDLDQLLALLGAQDWSQ